MLGLSNLISPKTGLIMIRKKISEALEKEVKAFDLMYITANDKLQFIVDGKCFSYESDMLKMAILKICSQKLEKGQHIDIIQIRLSESNEVTAKLYFTQNNVKEFVNLTL